MIDPILRTCQEDQLEQVAQLIRICVNLDSDKRPTMSPEFAVPTFSPLWQAEIEISSA